MATPSSNVFQTYQAIGNREDLTDYLNVVDAEETPIYSMSEKTKANARYVEWQIDDLDAVSTTGSVEGDDYSFSALTPTTRVGNWTQIFRKTYKVSLTQNTVDTAGREKEYAHQADKAIRALKRNIEATLMNGTGNSGASGTAREIKGLEKWIATNSAAGGASAFSETMLNSMAKTLWDAGARPNKIVARSHHIEDMADFTGGFGGVTVNVDAKSRELYRGVHVFNTPYGRLDVVPHQFMNLGTVIMGDFNMLAIPVLRNVGKKDALPGVGDFIAGVVDGELSLAVKNEQAFASYTSLATS
jgi:hypothetical protein